MSETKKTRRSAAEAFAEKAARIVKQAEKQAAAKEAFIADLKGRRKKLGEQMAELDRQIAAFEGK